MYRVQKRTLTPYQKELILERDNYLCVYCLSEAFEVDHVIPFSWSQCDDPDNLVACCHECNLIAHDLIFDNFNLKSKYIRTIRQGRKWSKKIRRASTRSQCNECNRCFRPLYKGATLFVCPECAKEIC